MALDNPVGAYLQAAQMRERNRQQAMQDAMGIGQNLGGLGQSLGSAVEALKKKKLLEQLTYAMQQPQQTPMQGPSLPGMSQIPQGVSPSAPQPGQMTKNPNADVMGPLAQLFPDVLQKALLSEMTGETFKNLQTGRDKENISYGADAAEAALGGDVGKFSKLTGGKPIDQRTLTVMGQARGREGVQNRFQDTMGDRETNRQLRIDRGIADIGLRIDNHPVIKKLREQEISLEQVSELIDLVKSGNSVASSGMGIKMAKTMGEVGVMTDQDIKRYIQSGKLTQIAGDKLSQWLKGTPSEATLEEITQIADVLKGSFDRKMQPFFDRIVNLASRNYQLSPEDVAFRLDVPYTGITAKSVAKEVNNNDLSGMSDEELRKIISGGK